MTGAEETRRLSEERDRLDQELDGLAEKLVDAESGTQSAQMLQRSANEAETRLAGVCHLIDEYGADATVTVQGLDAGGYARVQDRAEAIRAQRDKPGDVPGARSNIFAAQGLVDAPFLDAEDLADEVDPLDAKLAAVSSQPLGVAKYLESIANELTTVSEGNFASLQERLAEKQSSEN